ncbi:MAG: glycosyltransferase family 2 protein [Endozoicomonadaceae bacterium]|nr:glycosyltransferase family 2 protein [Endozoicomonadaceae bacterium]
MISQLSIVYITLNAEQYLQQSLMASQKLTDDILLVDSGSTDDTLAIAEQFNVSIIHQDWLGFAAQKQLAIESATNDWVLFLDADEVLSAAAIVAIQQLFQHSLQAQAYSLPRENWFQGKWIRHGSWWPDRVVRLVNRTQGKMKPVKVHESWQTKGQVMQLDEPIKHYSYQNYSELIIKADKYSTLGAEQLFAKGKRSKGWEPLTHAIASFIRLFLLKGGFKDGVEGAAIAYTTALASFMKYAKLQELQRYKDAKDK